MVITTCEQANAQVTTYYSFSETTSAYTSITGGTTILTGTNSDDGEGTSIPIGFTFDYAGTNYTTLTIGANGALTFTGTQVDYVNNLDGTATDESSMIAPLWDDLYHYGSSNSSEIMYKTTGTSPNRTFTVQWKDISWRGSGTSVEFQAVLYETSNNIYFNYGTLSSVESRGASIGISKGTSGTDFISVTPGSPATSSTASANDNISTSNYPGNGVVYIFTYSNCATPSSLTATGLATTQADLGWTENGTATQWDIEYEVSPFSFSGTPDIENTTTNPHTLAGLSPSTTYQYKVRADCSGSTSSWSSTFSFTTPGPMLYQSSDVTQIKDGIPITPGTNNNEIIRLEILCSGSLTPFNLTQMVINMTGTTNIGDIDVIDVYYTGTSASFSTTTPFSSGITPSAGSINVNGSQTLVEGTNYFWVVYDVFASAPAGTNYTDAECTQITLSGGVGNQTPTTTAPTGNRLIDLDPDIVWPGLNLGTLTCPSNTVKSGSTTGAIDDCSGSTGPDHIYSFTIEEEADVVLDMCSGNDFNPYIFLYNINAGECDPQGFIEATWDGCSSSSSFNSSMTKTGLAAGTYVVVIEASSTTASGNYSLTIDVSNCISYIDNSWPGYDIGTLNCPYSRTFTTETTGANDDCSNISGSDHIFKLTLSTAMDMEIDLCHDSTNFDTHLSVYNFSDGNCSGVPLYSNNDAGGTCGTQSTITQTMAAGSYVVVVEGNTGATGKYGLTISSSQTCSSALGTGVTSVGSLPYSSGSGTTVGAGNDIDLDPFGNQNAVTSCTGSTTNDDYLDGHDLVYEFTPTVSGDVNVTLTNPSLGYAGLFLYEGCPLKNAFSCGNSAGNCVERTTKSSSGGTLSISHNVTMGVTYYVILDRYGASGYTFDDLTISTPATCVTSLGSGVTTIASLPYSLASGSTNGGGDDLTNMNAVTNGNMSYVGGDDNVYIFTPTSSGYIDIALTKAIAGNDVGIKVYEGCPMKTPSIQAGSAVTSVENTSTANMSASACVQEGKAYYVVLSTYPSPQNFDFNNFSISAATCEDDLITLPYSATGQSTTGYGDDYVGSSATTECWYSSTYFDGDDRVYSFTPSVTGEISIDITNVSMNATLTLYEGCPFSCSSNSATCTGYLHDENEATKTLKANVELGKDYYLVLDSYSSGGYAYDIAITAPTELADDDDFCATAPFIAGSPTNLSNLDLSSATDDYPSDFDDVSCLVNTFGEAYRNVWYKFIPTQPSITFELNGLSSTNEVKVEIFSSTNGKCGTLTSIANDCDCNNTDITLTANVSPGVTHYIAIGACTSSSTPIIDVSTSGITSGSGIALPIELKSFESNCEDGFTHLYWETASEMNNFQFTIERSTDGFHFYPIGTILGAGNSTMGLSYEFVDENPPSELLDVYYVIRQTDFDGKYDYSKIINGGCNQVQTSNFLEVYPNPFENNLTLNFSEKLKKSVNIEIRDITGRLVFTNQLLPDNTKYILNLDNRLPVGTYFLIVHNGNIRNAHKVIKLK